VVVQRRLVGELEGREVVVDPPLQLGEERRVPGLAVEQAVEPLEVVRDAPHPVLPEQGFQAEGRDEVRDERRVAAVPVAVRERRQGGTRSEEHHVRPPDGDLPPLVLDRLRAHVPHP
jgi:hypothetical protein